MHIIERMIKIVVATLVSVWLASALGLSSSASAGIIAILSVLDTRKSSLKMAAQRFRSVLLALGTAVVCFTLFGFNLGAFGLYLAIYVVLAHYADASPGVAPSTVLVMHLLAAESVAPKLLGNEFALFCIGVSTALIVNIYATSKEKEIHQFHSRVEKQLKDILYRFESFLRQGSGTNDARLISELDAILAEALKVVYHDRHNHVFSQTNYQVHYFEMRQEQNRLLRQMATNINRNCLESEENILLAHLFKETAEQLSEKNPAISLIDEIEEALATFRKRSLPRTRSEFETRAILFQLLQDLERFIQLKVDFYKNYQE